MDEEALLLSEAHSDMEMVSIVGRYRRKTTVPLNHYMDLFADLKKEGTRILLKGDPGTGKTTFVHKLASILRRENWICLTSSSSSS